MQKELLLNDNQSESNCSFNSSQICSSLSRTASIISSDNLEERKQILMTPKSKIYSFNESQSQKTASIEKPRIFIHSEKPFFQQSPQFQLGFFVGKAKKNVQLNQSKIKKGMNFFEDDEITFNKDIFPNHSLLEFPQSRTENKNKEEISEFSIPCFRNIGKNKNLQFDQELLQKGKNFFDDDFEDTIFPSFQKQFLKEQSPILNFQKPTKVKKTLNNQSANQQNFIKTVNENKKQKKQKQKNKNKKISKKKIFDWTKFQISSKTILFKEESLKKSSIKNSTNSKRKCSRKIHFESLSYKDLDIKMYEDADKRIEFMQKTHQFCELIFFHDQKRCGAIKCLLCDLRIQENELDLGKLECIFSQKLILQKLDSSKFAQLFQQIWFKLLKYQTFFPQILNKLLNPSNILVQMHKKSKLIESGMPHLGWIDFCIKQSKFYHSFIAEVREVYHNEKINNYFILLADGWSNIWAIVTEKNQLYKFVHKLKILSKVFIGYWRNYSLANILSFCPLAKNGEKCIEIWYNSSIIVKENFKLGKPKTLIFYRPLHMNRKQGGIIPTVQGLIIRMFCPSVPKQKSSSYDQNTFSENFIEIITPEGFTVFIKFVLSTERSLAELFRLSYRYHFYFLKIGQKDNFLLFNDEISKFYEFQKKQKHSYEPELVKVFQKRYINVMNVRKMHDLKIGSLYDLKLQGKQGVINGCKFFIENGNEPENTNSYFKGGSLLYQQYELEHIEKTKNTNQDIKKMEFYLKKTKFSNILKSLPTVYEKLNLISLKSSQKKLICLYFQLK